MMNEDNILIMNKLKIEVSAFSYLIFCRLEHPFHQIGSINYQTSWYQTIRKSLVVNLSVNFCSCNID